MNTYKLMIFIGACSFGILSTLVKLAYRQGYTTGQIAFSQAFIGMLILWGLVLIKAKNKGFALINIKVWSQLLATGAAIGLTTFVYYLSVQYISASLAIVLLMQFTWLGPLLDWFLFKKKLQKNELIAILMILLGTIPASGLLGPNPMTISGYGLFLALLSAFLYTIYIVANSRAVSNVDSLTRSALIMSGSTMAIFAVNGSELLSDYHLESGLLTWSLFLAVFGTVIPPLLFAKAIPKVGAGLSSIILTTELPVAIACSHFFLHEQFGIMQWVGIIVMLIAIGSLKMQKPAVANN